MTMEELDLLILGAGWTATFLIPLLQKLKIAFAATTSNGRTVAGSPTVPFRFDPAAPDHAAAIASLPRARHVLITFPLVGKGPSEVLVSTYCATHDRRQTGTEGIPSHRFRFIQLGSTGIWNQEGGKDGPWMTRHSPYDASGQRVVAEDELLSLGGCVLNLAGLWGGQRNPRNWVGRVAATKEQVRGKKSLHLIHGVDVARAIVAVVQAGGNDDEWERVGKGQRWMLTDGFVYDWWSLLAGWAAPIDAEGETGATGEPEPSKQAKWVYELMAEDASGVRALPRSMEELGRCYDTREFWATFGIAPLRAGV